MFVKGRRATVFVAASCAMACACAAPARADLATVAASLGADSSLTAYIADLRAVDNHSHANSLAPADTDYDALPLDGIPLTLPARLRMDNPDWVAADKALYRYPYDDLDSAHTVALHGLVQGVATAQGERFPEWVLDQVGTEVQLANRIAMGPGLTGPRFRWVSYVDALLLPFSTRAEAALTPDRAVLYPREDRLLARYLRDRGLARQPATLDAYLAQVVTPTLTSQRKQGCVAVKFEAAYLRSLDFEAVPRARASAIYAKYARGGEPTHAEAKALEDYLFRAIARAAGRLGMAVHIHSFHAFGPYYDVAGSDPVLLESAFDDTTLRGTNFVILHGGGIYSARAGALTWRPNVYVDMSLMTLVYPPAQLAEVLKGWLAAYPEKVLYGSDAFAFGPDMGWDVTAWVAARNGRAALAAALTQMMHDGEISRARAEELATMVLRTNASQLYHLDLK